MKLHEYQSKKILDRYGIPVPKSELAFSPAEAVQAAENLGGSVVLKAQVLAGGRGKSGGVLKAANADEVKVLAGRLLNNELKGLCVNRVLVEQCIPIDKEIYLAVTIDLESKAPVVIASRSGGVDIEELAIESPHLIKNMCIDPLVGFSEDDGIGLARNIGLPNAYWAPFADITTRLWQLCRECDATLAEINPLAMSDNGDLIALDAKIILDDNALFRHPDLDQMRGESAEKPIGIEARKHGLSYIQLQGEVGCIVNGAGLAMAIMDMINTTRGRAGNFLDVGGGAGTEKVMAALRIVLSDRNIKIVLVNIFGGITRCDVVAKGIIKAVEVLKPSIPIVVRLAGTNAEEGNAMLLGKEIIAVANLSEAMKYIDELSAGNRR